MGVHRRAVARWRRPGGAGHRCRWSRRWPSADRVGSSSRPKRPPRPASPPRSTPDRRRILGQVVELLRLAGSRRRRNRPAPPERIELAGDGQTGPIAGGAGSTARRATGDRAGPARVPRRRTSPTSVVRRSAGARSRSPWPAATDCCSSVRRGPARRCSLGRSPGCCRRSSDAEARVASTRRVGRRRGPVDRARPLAPVPCSASHDQLRGDDRRRAAAGARRSHPGRRRRPVPGRAAGIRPGCPRGAPSAARGWPGHDRAGRRGADVARPLPARRGDEPLSVRRGRGSRRRLPLCAGRPGALRRSCLRSAPRPDRPVGEMPRVPAPELVGPARAGAERRWWRVGSPRARAVALARGRRANARLDGARLRAACRLRPADEELVASIAFATGLSARGVGRLLRVARTIADLDASPTVRHEHLEEAARFRVPGGPAVGRLAS